MAKFSGDEADPRVARTRQDVITVTSATLLETGWAGTTHAEIARRSGYSKVTLYAHWPTPFDLIRDAIAHICDGAAPAALSGDLRRDLHGALTRLAETLVDGGYDRLMAGVTERAGRDDQARDLRDLLYNTAVGEIRAALAAHLPPDHVGPVLAMLAGGILIRATYEGEPVTAAFIADLVDRALGPR